MTQLPEDSDELEAATLALLGEAGLFGAGGFSGRHLFRTTKIEFSTSLLATKVSEISPKSTASFCGGCGFCDLL